MPAATVMFTEQMHGYASTGQSSPQRGFEQGRDEHTPFMFQLTICAEDIDRFLTDPEHRARATGHVEGAIVGGKCVVDEGDFHLLIQDVEGENRRRMLYRLYFADANGQPMTLVGQKDIFDNPGFDLWRDTTTLSMYLLRGRVEHPDQDASAQIVAAGMLQIRLLDFLKQLTTFRASGDTAAARARALTAFGQFFLGQLWRIYGPSSIVPPEHTFKREIPLYTTEGVTDCEKTIHPFWTGDKLGLSLLRFKRKSCRDVVVIIHGLTTSSDMFIMPEHRNLVSSLLDCGFGDVWTLDFRMSNRYPYNLYRHRYSMDDVALFDMPAAVATVREHVGSDARIHVICHCLGAVSFMMALFGRTVTGIRSVIANSVALTPRVPKWSRWKLAMAPFAMEYLLGQPYLNPRWHQEPGFSVGKVVSKINSWFHRECDVPACHMLSLLWGTGWPALFNHRNLSDITHSRSGDLYGPTSVHYYRHVRKMVKSNSTAVKYDPREPRHRALPDNYFQYAADIRTPVLLTTGGENRVFTDSNIACYHRLQQIVPGRHQLHVFPSYGHQDVFMGHNVHRDIFPRLLTFLLENRSDIANDHQPTAGA